MHERLTAKPLCHATFVSRPSANARTSEPFQFRCKSSSEAIRYTLYGCQLTPVVARSFDHKSPYSLWAPVSARCRVTRGGGAPCGPVTYIRATDFRARNYGVVLIDGIRASQ